MFLMGEKKTTTCISEKSTMHQARKILSGLFTYFISTSHESCHCKVYQMALLCIYNNIRILMDHYICVFQWSDVSGVAWSLLWPNIQTN